MREIKILSVLDVRVVDQRNDDDENLYKGIIVVYWMERTCQMGNDMGYNNRDEYKSAMGQMMKKAANLIEQSDY